MEKEIAWVDKNYNTLAMDEIDDRYLLVIIRFMSNGGGHISFLTQDKVEALFGEADRRGLSHDYRVDVALEALNIKGMMGEMNSLFAHDHDW